MRRGIGLAALVVGIVVAGPVVAVPESSARGRLAASERAAQAECTAVHCDAVGAEEAWNGAEAAGAVATSTSDTLPPNIEGLVIAPTTVAVGDFADVRVPVRIDVVDDLSGFDGDAPHGYVRLRRPDRSELARADLLAPASGSVLEATFEVELAIPASTMPDDYALSVVLIDDAGNARTWFSASLVALGLPDHVTVVRPAAPPAPTVVRPREQADFCSGPAVVAFAGTTLPDHMVRFREQGNTLAEVMASSSGEFVLSRSFRRGTHTVSVQVYDPLATAAVMSPATQRTFTVYRVDGPVGGTMSQYGLVSPHNRDGIRDTTELSTRVYAAGAVRFRIDSARRTVRTSRWFAVRRGELPDWEWDGQDESGRDVRSGDYRAVSEWRAGGCRYERRGTRITVDNVAPDIAGGRANLARVYPREDDAFVEYKDIVTFRYRHLDETADVALEVSARRGGGVVFTKGIGARKPGSGDVSWNGRTRAGVMLPPGDYVAVWRLTDRAGNVRRSERMHIAVSGRRVVERHDRIQLYGDQYQGVGVDGCGFVSTVASWYDRGVWLAAPDCYWDDYAIDFAALQYGFRLRSAIAYGRGTVSVDGLVSLPRNSDGLFGAVVRDDDHYRTFTTELTTRSRRWSSFESVPLAPYVNGKTLAVDLLTYSPCDCDGADYDIALVALDYSYGVLE